VTGPDFGIALGLAYQAFVAALRSSLADEGFEDLGRSDGYVFRALAESPMTVSALAVRLGITKQGAAQIVDDMQRRGYVRRDPDPTDGRAQLVALADRGDAALAAARRFHRRYERRLARDHGEAAVRTVRAVLTAMAGSAGDVPGVHLRAMYL
jgi:DNA-binding MarR family transcriptional regulator